MYKKVDFEIKLNLYYNHLILNQWLKNVREILNVHSFTWILKIDQIFVLVLGSLLRIKQFSIKL